MASPPRPRVAMEYSSPSSNTAAARARIAPDAAVFPGCHLYAHSSKPLGVTLTLTPLTLEVRLTATPNSAALMTVPRRTNIRGISPSRIVFEGVSDDPSSQMFKDAAIEFLAVDERIRFQEAFSNRSFFGDISKATEQRLAEIRERTDDIQKQRQIESERFQADRQRNRENIYARQKLLQRDERLQSSFSRMRTAAEDRQGKVQEAEIEYEAWRMARESDTFQRDQAEYQQMMEQLLLRPGGAGGGTSVDAEATRAKAAAMLEEQRSRNRAMMDAEMAASLSSAAVAAELREIDEFSATDRVQSEYTAQRETLLGNIRGVLQDRRKTGGGPRSYQQYSQQQGRSQSSAAVSSTSQQRTEALNQIRETLQDTQERRKRQELGRADSLLERSRQARLDREQRAVGTPLAMKYVGLNTSGSLSTTAGGAGPSASPIAVAGEEDRGGMSPSPMGNSTVLAAGEFGSPSVGQMEPASPTVKVAITDDGSPLLRADTLVTGVPAAEPVIDDTTRSRSPSQAKKEDGRPAPLTIPSLEAAASPVATKPTTPPMQQSQSTPTAAADTTTGDWKEMQDPKTGRTYWYNKATKKTTWNEADVKGAVAASPVVVSPSATVGADWKEMEDPKTGRKYWYNKVTKKTTWNEADVKVTAASPAASPTSSDWKEMQDSKTGRTYWYNKATKKTTWNEADTISEAAASPTSSDWKEMQDPKTGRTYWYNKATKKTTWNEADVKGAVAASPVVVSPSATVGSDWKEMEDPKTGRKYWYNKVTKKTTWNEADVKVTAASPAASPTSSDWKEMQDPKTGRTYWYNKATKKTTWKEADTK